MKRLRLYNAQTNDQNQWRYGLRNEDNAPWRTRMTWTAAMVIERDAMRKINQERHATAVNGCTMTRKALESDELRGGHE